MEFTEIVYKVPGTNAGPDGKTYSWCAVNSKEELEAKLKEGWYNTLAEACGIEDDNKPPTRKELEEKAKELGISYSPNIGDKKLLERITEVLKD